MQLLPVKDKIIKEVLLISPTYIRENSNVSNNIQDKFLQSAIRETTNIDFQEIVGTKMLKKLKELVIEKTIDDDENSYYKDLLDNAKYFIMFGTIKRLIMISNFKIDNVGLNKTNDDNIETLDFDGIVKIRQYYENEQDFYANILQGYCLENYTKLPELAYCNCKYLHADLHSSANCNIFLGGARGKGGVKTKRYKKYAL